MDDASTQPTADMGARLAALEQRTSMEIQMGDRKELVIKVFKSAILALEAAPSLGSTVDENGLLTAVDNSPYSDVVLKDAVNA
ncbi:hypothetical protein GGI20_001310 [Coemansia sp. BCRC 34301]|nr:hypothetical protein GGI20_001310 [Coemansia sp. BCRC 34301]